MENFCWVCDVRSWKNFAVMILDMLGFFGCAWTCRIFLWSWTCRNFFFFLVVILDRKFFLVGHGKILMGH